MFVLGIGIDYSLFITREEDSESQLDTLHSLLVCVLSTTLEFSMLAASDILVLHAIGLTVAIGVMSSFVFAVLVVLPYNKNHNKAL